MRPILIAADKLCGSHQEMGRQHAQQVHHYRRLLRQRMEARLINAVDPAFAQSLLEELWAIWQDRSLTLIEMLCGLADGLEFSEDLLLRYISAAYVEDRWRFACGGRAPDSLPKDGCTVWVAAGAATRSGEPLLVKNRDYRLDHQRLQLVAQVQPATGYRYLCVTSAGVPGVFSSGLNEAGLAIADTRVLTPDLGAGLPSYALMMNLLESHDSVSSALEYLRSIPLMGGYTLTLTDDAGQLAVLEVGHRRQERIQGEQDFLVTTNHFVSEPLRDMWVDEEPLYWQGSSLRRRAVVESRLTTAHSQITTTWAKQLSADPDVCRRAGQDFPFATLSTAIYLPQRRRLLFRQGPPWMGRYMTFQL